MTQRLRDLAAALQSRSEDPDPSHDSQHIARVVETCRWLASVAGADLEILLPAAYLHDVVNVPKNHPDRARASQLAAEAASEILRTNGYRPDEIERIQKVILEHSYSRGLKPTSIESAVLQDADRLDSLGAIGVMRTVTCGARMECRYYHSSFARPNEAYRDLDEKRFTLDHFETKLFKLAAQMNLEPARVEAERRSGFMRAFVEQLRSEVTPKERSD